MILILSLTAFLILLYYHYKTTLSYWKTKGVSQKSILMTFYENLFIILQRQSAAELGKRFYNAFPNKRYYGIIQFNTPVLVIKSPDLLKQILIKDFDNFTDRRTMVPEDVDPLWGKNVFALKGHSWKTMRSSLSPSFTSSKMKWLFTLMKETTNNFLNYYQEEKVYELEMKDLFMRYCNDIIATTVFGIEVDSLRERDNTFFQMSTRAFDFKNLSKFVKLFGYMISPSLYRFLGLKVFDEEVNQFFRKVIDDSIKNREENNIIRRDMIHILMEARKGVDNVEDKDINDAGFATVHNETTDKVTKHFTNEDITAQALIFFFAGLETASTLMSFAAYELAVNVDVQNLLRDEINDTLNRCNGELTYEALINMKYMDKFVSEALRKWPPVIGVDRVCVNSYTIHPTSPDEKPLHLEKGNVIMFLPFGIQHDPNYYPDPDVFDPERFSDENKKEIKQCTYLPFGSGPRGCIGSRYALMETKVVFFHIIKDFEIVPVGRTKNPIVLANSMFDLCVKDGNWLGFKRLG